MKRWPYFKWFASDMESDEWFQGLTDAEIGYYVRLMNHCWTNGSIPSDSAHRCRLFRIHHKTEQAAFKNLSRMFQEDLKDPSRMVHGPLQGQLKDCTSRSVKATESVNHRYERRTDETVIVGTSSDKEKDEEKEPPTPNAPDGACSEGDSVIPISHGILARPTVRSSRDKRTSEQIKAALGERLPWWESFWSVYPCHQSMREALEVFDRKVTTRELAVAVYQGARRYAALAKSDPETKQKFPQGWLNGERWTDECALPAAPVARSISRAWDPKEDEELG